MVIRDTEADAQLTLQPIYLRHCKAKGVVKPFIAPQPTQIHPYKSVTAYGEITVSVDYPRFIVIDDKGKRNWRVFDRDGSPPLDTSVLKYANILLNL
jgi:hypothetical protein